MIVSISLRLLNADSSWSLILMLRICFLFDVGQSNSVPLVAPKHTITGQSNITIDVRWEPSLYDNFVVDVRNFVSRLDRVNYLCIRLSYFDMISVDELKERVVEPLTNIEELKIIVDTAKSFHNSVDCYGVFVLVFQP